MGKTLFQGKLTTINILALAAFGGGLSGGDRIFIEFARNWSKEAPVNVYVWEEGLLMCKRENLKGAGLKIRLVRVGNIAKLGFIINYFYRIFLGLKLGLNLQIKEGSYVYSSSEFWMDSLAAILIKLRMPNIKWVATWWQTAPNPFQGFTEGERKRIYRLDAFLYWLMQLPIKPIISRCADFVLVNNDQEKKNFDKNTKKSKVIVVGGAVNTKLISNYLKLHYLSKQKKYLAVFQGRFHPQKGVVELIDIWQLVTKKIPDAKLAMIGDGPLMGDVKKRIEELNLGNNIELFGYLHDGEKKYSIFNNSKIVVHPAFYDSGGMAALEAIAFGLPCIGFNLQSYYYYFPKEMIKVSVGDLEQFAKQILKLNKNKSFYNKISKNMRKLITEKYSWTNKSLQILSLLGLK